MKASLYDIVLLVHQGTCAIVQQAIKELVVGESGLFRLYIGEGARQIVAVKGIRNAKVATIHRARHQIAIFKLGKAEIAIYELTIDKRAIPKNSSLQLSVNKSNVFKVDIFIVTA